MSSALGHSGVRKPIPVERVEASAGSPSAYYEELLHTIERMQQEQKRKSVAFAGAVHDLKTPLAVVTGFVNLLAGQKLGVVSPRQMDALQDIATSCRRLEDAIGKLLCHSANEARRHTVSLVVTDFNSCLSQIREMWAPVFEQKGISFGCKPPDELVRFAFDRQKVQQVISNLLENALKFTPAGGEVSMMAEPYFWDRRAERKAVSTERRVSQSQGSNSVRIVVSDSGPGISPEYHQEIFDEFFSLSRPGVTPGIGLGLTIARHLVQAHQGKIWVENIPGEGATFCILLPCVSPAKPQ